MSYIYLSPDTLALLSGIAAACCLTSSLMFRGRQAMLLVQVLGCLFLASHYWCLGITVAVAANILGAVQTAAALRSGRSAALAWLGYALIVLLALLGLYFWQGPISALGVIAQSLVALGRMQSDMRKLRVLLLMGGCVWMIHDFAIDAWIVFAADVANFAVGAVALGGLALQRALKRLLPPPGGMASAPRARTFDARSRPFTAGGGMTAPYGQLHYATY